MNSLLTPGRLARVGDAVVTIVSINGGWTTVKSASGENTKVRNRSVGPMSDDEIAALSKPKAATPEVEYVDQRDMRAAAVAKAKAAAPAPATSEEEPAALGALTAVNSNYKRNLHSERVVTATGTKAAMDCNDEVAAELRVMTVEQVYNRVADALTTFKHKRVAKSGTQDAQDDIRAELKRMYSHLNPGMQRMNLGNLMRTAIKARRRAQITSLAEFVTTVRALPDVYDAYYLFENSTSEDVRAEIYSKADAASPEPFRSAMINLGFENY
jgi:hypothetical protein